MQKRRIYHQSLHSRTLNSRFVTPAIERIISPDIQKRMPAKSIFEPVMSGVIPNSPNPNFINGYAQPHAMAAVRAKTVTHTGC